ncbi:MAG: hypothetical protein AAGN15_22070 [Cyanobacteria bacterium J06581_3]
MSNAPSSFTEPYAALQATQRSDCSQPDINTPVSTHQPAINQSPEQQHFEMSLLPGHNQPIYSPLSPQRLNPSPARSFFAKPFAAPIESAPSKRSIAADMTALQQQQAALHEQIQQQAHITSERIKGLRHQLDRQEVRHQNEILRLTSYWEQQLAALETHRTDSAQTRSQQRLEPRKSSSKKSPLRGVSTTYQVPSRAQSHWMDSSLGAIPTFIWLVMLGIGMAGASAIALSPTVLWPSLSIYIRAAIPLLFVTGLLGLGVTAVWDTFR